MELLDLEKSLSNNLVTQSNKLIEARYTLTVYEQRIVLLLASMVEPNDDEFKEYVFNFNSLVKFLNLKNKNIHTQIKKILEKLRSRTLTINSKNKDYLITGWISSAEYVSSENVVKLCFGEKLKPYLLELKANFTKQRLGTLVQFKGTSTVRIYALLKQYEKIGKRDFLLEDFKEILGLQEKYPEYKNFKRRVILTAKNEFSSKDSHGRYISDINFKLDTEKKGRKINFLKFTIIRQNTRSPVLKAENILEQHIPSVISEFKALGIKQEIVLPYLEKDGEDALKQTIEIFESDKKSGKIRSNEQGYLVALLKNGAGVITEAEKKEIKEKEMKARKAQKKLKQEEKERVILLLGKKFYKARKDEYLSELNGHETSVILGTIKDKYRDNAFFLSMIEDIGSPCIQEDIAKIVKSVGGYSSEKNAYIKEHLQTL